MHSRLKAAKLAVARCPKAAWVVLCAGAGLSLAGFLAARQWEMHRFQAEFRLGAENRISAIRREIDANLGALNAMRGMAEAGEALTRASFDTFAARILESHTSVRAIEWVERVPDSRRAQFEEALKRDGAPQPRITQGRPGHGEVAPSRREYFAVRFLYPHNDANGSALGYDVGACRSCEAVLAESARSGKPAAIAKIKILEHTGDGYAIPAVLAVYRRTAAAPDESPQLAGYAMALIQIADVLESALRHLNPQGINIQFFDRSAAAGRQLLYFHKSRTEREAVVPLSESAVGRPATLQYVKTLPVAGRQWLVACTPTAATVRDAATWRPWALLLAGVLTAICIALYLAAKTANAGHALQLVFELQAANQRLNEEVRVRTETEQALAAARDEAVQASLLKSQFLATVSHEIRTPMNGIIGMTSLLMDSDLSSQQLEYAVTARRSSEALLHLIDDLLDLAKIEAGRMTIVSHPFDLRALLGEVRELFAADVKAKGLDLNLSYAPDAPRWFRADAGRIRQVVINLVGNAVKFTASGHISISVDCGAPAANKMVEVRVQDTGIGIGRDKLGILFQKFSQADSSTTRKYGGTGLGLAISKQLVELMGGTIGMTSEPGSGSTFWFRLPLQAEGRKEAEPGPAAPPRVAEPLPAFEPLRILVAEDNLINQRVAVAQLEKLGYRADAVSNGLEAVEAFREAPYPLILMDCQMPELDGYEATRQIRQLQQPGWEPVIIACTASDREEDRQRCMAAGMNDFLSKPVEAGRLGECLRHWTSEAKKRVAVAS